MGDLPVPEATPGHVIFMPLPNLRAKQRIFAIWRGRPARGRRGDDRLVDAASPLGDVKVRNLRALPYEGAAECLATGR